MKQNFIPTLLLATLLLATGTVQAGTVPGDRNPGVSTPPAPFTDPYLTGTVIIKLRKNAVNERGEASFGIPALDAILANLGAEARRPLFPLAPWPADTRNGIATPQGAAEHGFERIYILHYSSPYDAAWAAGQIAAVAEVEFAEPYYIFAYEAVPNDPRLPQQYWATVTKLKEAWEVTRGDTNVVIAICDSGVDWTHEDLAANIYTNPGESGTDASGNDRSTNGIDDDNNGKVDDYHGWDLVGNPRTVAELQTGQYRPDNNPAPRFTNTPGWMGDHGTGVAGCASAVGDNGLGITGAGFSARILPIKASDDSIATGAVVAGYEAVVYAADMNADIINCSWGASVTRSFDMRGLQSVIDYARAKGSLIVGATGNSGFNNDIFPHIPSNLHNVLAVGATNSLDSVAGFSNYGLSADIYAPGDNVLTTTIAQRGFYSNTSGTSFSAPIVAGIASLVFAVHPDWTPEQVALQMRVTGDRVRIPSGAFSPRYYRRVNALSAVTINRDLASGDTSNRPGVDLLSYTFDGQTLDTIRTRDVAAGIRLTLKNYLAPTRNLKVEALPGQSLTTVAAVSVPPIGTLETATTAIQVRMNPTGPVLISEGHIVLVLRLTDGAYEDYVSLRIPVKIPGGWTQQVDPYISSTSTVQGHSIHAAGINAAWNVTGVLQPGGFAVATGFARTSNGRTWSMTQQIPPGTEAAYAVTATSDRRAWVGTGPASGQAGILRTTNGGTSWQRTSVSSITPFVNDIHMFDSLNGIFVGDPLSGRWGIGTTTDGGATWSPLSARVVATGSEAGWNNSLAAFGDRLWFGTNSSRVYRSTNRGLNWTWHDTPGQNLTTLDFATTQDGLALFTGLAQGGGTNSIAVTHNAGATWASVPPPFTGAIPHGVAFARGTTRAFVGTQNGIYETSDFGTTWQQMAVPELFGYSGMWLSAATDARGSLAVYGINDIGEVIAYREIVPDSVASAPVTRALPFGMTLSGSTPNPVTDHASIGFSLERGTTIELAIHSVTGERVMRLAADYFAAGEHSLPADLSALPSGTYHIIMSAEGARVSRSLVVTR